MTFEGIHKTGNGWRVEIRAGHTTYSLTLGAAWRFALEIIQAIHMHYVKRIIDNT